MVRPGYRGVLSPSCLNADEARHVLEILAQWLVPCLADSALVYVLNFERSLHSN